MTINSPTPFQTGFRLIDGNDLNTNFAHPFLSSENSITATAGGGKTNAYQLTTRINRVTTVATAADSVKLTSALPGKVLYVINNGANAMQVFGKGTDTINAVATATGISQPANSIGAYECVASGAWVTNVGLAQSFSSLVFNGATSGTTTVQASAIAGSTTATLPAVTGTLASTSGTNLFIPDVKVLTAQKDTITTVLADIPGFTGQTLVAGATYRFRCVLPGTADGTSGISYGFNYTTATLTSIEATGIGYIATATSAVQHTTTTTTQTLLFDKAAVIIMTILEGTMVVNAGGTVALQVGTHTGTTTASVYLGASMEFTRIA